MKDLVWKNTLAKQRAFARLIEQFPDAVCLAWYSKTRDRWKQELVEKSVYTEPVDIKLAAEITSGAVDGKTIIFLEHNLSLQKEEDFGARCRPLEAIVLSSLEDDLFHDIKDNLVSLMDKMGMKEDEFLENPMLTKSLKRKQHENDEMGIS